MLCMLLITIIIKNNNNKNNNNNNHHHHRHHHRHHNVAISRRRTISTFTKYAIVKTYDLRRRLGLTTANDKYDTRKYDQGLSHLLHTELHWLDIPEQVLYCISLLRWSTNVSRTRRRSICRTTACQSLKLPVVSNCDLPLVISFY